MISEETNMKIHEVGFERDKIKVTECISIPEEELAFLLKDTDSKNFEHVQTMDNGFSMGYLRTLYIVRKKGTDAHYRFMVITYEDDQTVTNAHRVFPVTKTFVRNDYTNVLDKEEDSEIIKGLPLH